MIETTEKPIIDFKEEPIVTMKKILSLPFEEQGQWIDLWLEEPEVKADLERKRQHRKIANIVRS